MYLGRWEGRNFIPGDVGSFYIKFQPGDEGEVDFRRIPFKDALEDVGKGKDSGNSTISTNNGICVVVDEAGGIHWGRSSLVPKGQELPSNSYVPLSNGEAFADPDANEQVWKSELMSYASGRGVRIDAPNDPIVDGAQQYEPDLPTLAEQVATDTLTLTQHSNRLARFKTTLDSADSAKIERILEELAKKEGVEFDKSKTHSEILIEVIEAQEKVVKKIQSSIETVKGFDSIGYHSIEISKRDLQQLHDVGKYTLDEENGLIRFVDPRGRYMEAPLTEATLKTLKEKGYAQKYEEVDSDGRTLTGSEVVKPRQYDQPSERTNSYFVASVLEAGALRKMLNSHKPAFGVGRSARSSDGFAGGIVEG